MFRSLPPSLPPFLPSRLVPTSRAQALLPQPSKYLELQICTTAPSQVFYYFKVTFSWLMKTDNISTLIKNNLLIVAEQLYKILEKSNLYC
jgi:hypothetical protein